MNCNTTHYRANSSSVPGDPTEPGKIEELGRKVSALEDQVDELGQAVEALKEENQFLHQLLENPTRSSPRKLPPSAS